MKKLLVGSPYLFLSGEDLRIPVTIQSEQGHNTLPSRIWVSDSSGVHWTPHVKDLKELKKNV